MRSKELRRAKIIGEVVAGKTIGQVAREMKLSRTTVSQIVNSKDAQAARERAQLKITSLVDDAVDTMRIAITAHDRDLTNAVKASMAILNSEGILKNKTETKTVHEIAAEYTDEELLASLPEAIETLKAEIKTNEVE